MKRDSDSRRDPRQLRRSVEHDIDEELAYHLDRADNPDAAQELQRYREALVECDVRFERRQRRRMMVDVCVRATRSFVQTLRRAPGFSMGVVLLLALGLGLNTVTFGLVSRLFLLGPVGIDRPNELHRLRVHHRESSGASTTFWTVSYPDYLDLSRTGVLAGVAAENSLMLLFDSGNNAERLPGRLVTANFFDMLGIRPVAGRFFTNADVDENARVAVLSAEFWRRRFTSDPTVVGRTVPVGIAHYTVVGIAPPAFTGASVTRVDVFLPLEVAAAEQVSGNWRNNRGFSWIRLLARRPPGTSAAAMEDHITTVLRAGRADEPTDREVTAQLRPIDLVEGDVKVAVLIAATAALVLFASLANLTNLFLARGLRRRHQSAIQLALGASRVRVMAEQALEGSLLALLGAVVAVALAYLTAPAVQTMLLPDVDWVRRAFAPSTLVVLAAVAIISGAVAAGLPAWQTNSVDLISWLRVSTQRHSRRRTPTQAALLMVQGALATVLLVGAGLFAESLSRVQSLDLGVDVDRVLVLSTTRHRGAAPVSPEFLDRLQLQMQSDQAVERFAVAAGTVPFVSSWGDRLAVDGLAELPVTDDGGPYAHYVTAGYFDTIGTRILEGRDFTEEDRRSSAPVAVVNQTMARLFWPGTTAIGKCLRVGSGQPPCSTVVGIAENTRRQEVVEGESLLYYLPIHQAPPALQRNGVLLVRTRADASGQLRLAEAIRRLAFDLDSGLRFVRVRPLSQVLAPQVRNWRLGASVFSAFGILALVVSGAGLYSVVAFDVEGRRREIGIRMALGATGGRVSRLVVGGALWQLCVGVAAGLVAAWFASPLAGDLLYGVTSHEPNVFFGAVAILIATVFVSSLVPALRASRMAPTEALRD